MTKKPSGPRFAIYLSFNENEYKKIQKLIDEGYGYTKIFRVGVDVLTKWMERRENGKSKTKAV